MTTQSSDMSFVTSAVLIAFLAYLVPAASISAVSIDADANSTAPFEEYGVVGPADPFRFSGQSLQLNCTITNLDVMENSSSLFFQRKTAQGRAVLEAGLVQIVDRQTITLTLPNVDLKDEGTYTCLLRPGSLGRIPTIVGHQFLTVDHEPQEVQNISCEVYNWRQMTCEWDLGVSFQHPDSVQVDVRYVIFTGAALKPCPAATKTSCFWDLDKYEAHHHYWVEVHVFYLLLGQVISYANKLFGVAEFSGKPVLEEASADISTFQALVRPAPVQNLTGWAENDSCVLLTWRYPWGWVEPKNKTFVGQVSTPGGGTGWSNIFLNVTSDDLADRFSRQALVCDLLPHTLYVFRVAVEPFSSSTEEASRQGHTSDWKETSVPTEQGVPDAPPLVCPGCFYENPAKSETRKVEIIWKDIAKASRRGRLMHYNVTYKSLTSQRQHSVLSDLDERGAPMTSVQLILPSRSEDFLIQIAGATAAGQGPFSASIVIPASGKVSEAVPHHVGQLWIERTRPEEGPLNLFLKWTLPRRKEAAGNVEGPSTDLTGSQLYFVWCKGNRLDYECKERVGWEKLPLNQLEYRHESKLAQFDPNDLLIGIAVKAEDATGGSISSGLYWSPCLYIKDQIPTKLPGNLRAFPNSSAHGLTVLWERHGCREEPSRITAYKIHYKCLGPDGDHSADGEEGKLEVRADDTKVVLPNLVSNNRYQVSVAAVSDGLVGPPRTSTFIFSDVASHSDSSADVVIISIVFAGVFAVFVTSLIVFRCYKKEKKLVDINSLLGPTPATNVENGTVEAGQPTAANFEQDVANVNTPLIALTQLNHQADSGRTREGETSPLIPGCGTRQNVSVQSQSICHQPPQRFPSSSTLGSATSYQVMSIERQDGLTHLESNIDDRSHYVQTTLTNCSQPTEQSVQVFQAQVDVAPLKDSTSSSIPPIASYVAVIRDLPEQTENSVNIGNEQYPSQRTGYVANTAVEQCSPHPTEFIADTCSENCLPQPKEYIADTCPEQCLPQPIEYIAIASEEQCLSQSTGYTTNTVLDQRLPTQSGYVANTGTDLCLSQQVGYVSSIAKDRSVPQQTATDECSCEHAGTEFSTALNKDLPRLGVNVPNTANNETLHRPDELISRYALDPGRGVILQHQTSRDSGHSSPQADRTDLSYPFNQISNNAKASKSQQDKVLQAHVISSDISRRGEQHLEETDHSSPSESQPQDIVFSSHLERNTDASPTSEINPQNICPIQNTKTHNEVAFHSETTVNNIPPMEDKQLATTDAEPAATGYLSLSQMNQL